MYILAHPRDDQASYRPLGQHMQIKYILVPKDKPGPASHTRYVQFIRCVCAIRCEGLHVLHMNGLLFFCVCDCLLSFK